MPVSHYNLSTAALRGRTPEITGYIYFVDGTNGTSNGDGKLHTPVDSIENAFNISGLSAGDAIVCLPGHTETVTAAAGIDADVAGVYVLGLGSGASRPTITFSTATTADMDIDAASITFDNFIFTLTGIDAVAAAIDVNSTDFTLKNSRIIMASATTQAVVAIDINGGSANACDNARIIDCEFTGTTDAGANQAIELGEVADNIQIIGCNVFGDYANACIHNPTGKVLTNLLIKDCILMNAQTGDHSIELISACTGNLVRNYYNNNMTQATGVDPGACKSFQCYHSDAVDTSGILAPVET